MSIAVKADLSTRKKSSYLSLPGICVRLPGYQFILRKVYSQKYGIERLSNSWNLVSSRQRLSTKWWGGSKSGQIAHADPQKVFTFILKHGSSFHLYTQVVAVTICLVVPRCVWYVCFLLQRLYCRYLGIVLFSLSRGKEYDFIHFLRSKWLCFLFFSRLHLWRPSEFACALMQFNHFEVSTMMLFPAFALFDLLSCRKCVWTGKTVWEL